jgi:hypothetical protein
LRVLVVDTCYPAFLTAHYAARPELASQAYRSQWSALMGTFFGTADAYSHYLGLAGHAGHEVVVNCPPLQAAWAAEHLPGRSLRGWRTRELVLDQADWWEADVVYVQDLTAISPRVLRRLGRRRLLVGQIATELPARDRLKPFDLIVSSLPHYVERLPSLGLDTAYLRIGFDPRVLDAIGPPPQLTDAVFVGTLGRTQHATGNALLEQAARRVPLDFWGTSVDAWPPDSPVRRRYRGEAWGLDMYRVLAGARIAVNRHGDVAEDHANNMRLFEATGVASLLLTDAKRNLAELFEPGREVVAYRDEDELVERVEHLLAHEEERAAIARAGQERTLRDHTYGVRMRELADILTRRL